MWSFFGLLATSAIWAGQKMAQDGEKIIMQEQKEKYFKLLDEAAREYMENAVDMKLQKELELEMYNKDGSIKEKYYSEWLDIVEDFNCFTDPDLLDIMFDDEELLRSTALDYSYYTKFNKGINVISFFMAKQGKSYLKKYENVEEYDSCLSHIKYGNEGTFYSPNDFDDYCTELVLRTLKENKFPYNFRFVKSENMGVDFYEFDEWRAFQYGINTWDTKFEALKHIEENSFIGIPKPKGLSGFFILEEFKHLHLWGDETNDKNFYKIY